MTLQIMKVHFC